ncbi:MAG: hypothetical protein IJP70_00940 [Bacteroidales bacterium]|nr:hypothetical protein [Bacteroidales bacterium]
MTTIIGIIIWVACIYGCYSVAQKNGRNTTLAIIWGVLFSWIALIVYLIMGKK